MYPTDRSSHQSPLRFWLKIQGIAKHLIRPLPMTIAITAILHPLIHLQPSGHELMNMQSVIRHQIRHYRVQRYYLKETSTKRPPQRF